MKVTPTFSNLPSHSHLLNVGAALADDILVELLEDGHREREAALDLQEGRRSSIKVGRTEKVTTGSRRSVSYQVCDDFLKELGAFFHLVLGSPQLDDVTLLRRVGEVDNHLEAAEKTIIEITKHWVKEEEQEGGRAPRGTCPALL